MITFNLETEANMNSQINNKSGMNVDINARKRD